MIAFDRPGFGHSTRPRDRLWTPAAQAELLYAALALLGVERPAIVGHSLGATVALAWALDHPDDVHSLVLLAGYYYPTPRADALLTAPVALPGLDDAMRYNGHCAEARALLGPTMKLTFSPRGVPPDFFPIYTLLTKDQEYTGQGQDYYEQRYRERVLWALSQRAVKLGMKMVAIEQPA